MNRTQRIPRAWRRRNASSGDVRRSAGRHLAGRCGALCGLGDLRAQTGARFDKRRGPADHLCLLAPDHPGGHEFPETCGRSVLPVPRPAGAPGGAR